MKISRVKPREVVQLCSVAACHFSTLFTPIQHYYKTVYGLTLALGKLVLKR